MCIRDRFQRDPLLSGAIAYNILTDRKDIIKPIGFHRESTALNDTDMKYLLLYLEETYGLTNEKKIDNAIGLSLIHIYLWLSSIRLSRFFRRSLSPSVPVSQCGVLSTCLLYTSRCV